MDNGETKDRVWVQVGGMVNLGNYENIKIDMGQSRSIGPDEDPDEIRNKMCEKVLDDVIAFGKTFRNDFGGD